jgi:hypothetical protein
MEKHRVPFKGVEENEAIRSILEGTSSETGEAFFASLVETFLKCCIHTGHGVTEYMGEKSISDLWLFFWVIVG